jgi:hypothetical protein
VIETATIDAVCAAGIEARDQLLTAQGGSWPVERVAKYLGLTRQAGDKRRKANKLIGAQAMGLHNVLVDREDGRQEGRSRGQSGSGT